MLSKRKSEQYLATLQNLESEAAKLWRPPPKLTVSEWSDEHRRLSSEASAEPGRWRTERAPYQAGIMDAFNDRSVDTIVFMKSAQIGATEILNNILGYCIDHEPSPCLILQPTVEMGSAWSKDRLATMLRDTPRLQGKVGERRSKDSDNTILHKTFPGGHLTVAGANSAASLASRPIRVCLADEVDRYPISVGSEGDPLSLAFRRTTTFTNRKRYVCSTPTIAGISRIEAAFEESDKRRYFVPCPHCETMQTLKWANVKWPDGEPGAAVYACDECGSVIEDAHKPVMLRKGEWRAECESHGVAGFHINELYSPWSKFSDMAIAFVEAKKSPELLKTWVNCSLGEVWQESGDEIEPHEIMARAENYDTVPHDALILTAACDVQGDRLEVETKAWGLDEESWSIDHQIFYGDPGKSEIWRQLEDYRKQTFERSDGQLLRINTLVIDSGGHYTTQVYRFCQGKTAERVHAIKGVGGVGRPIIGRPTKANKLNVPVWPVGVDTARELYFGRLRIDQAGPGYCHFPSHYDTEWFEQLTAEKRVERMVRGQKTHVWKKIRRRNEAWDLGVYNVAAFDLLNPNLPAISDRMAVADDPEPKTETRRPPKRSSSWVKRKRGGGFVTNWKK